MVLNPDQGQMAGLSAEAFYPVVAQPEDSLVMG